LVWASRSRPIRPVGHTDWMAVSKLWDEQDLVVNLADEHGASRRTRSFAEFLPAECMVPTEMGRDEEHENCDRWPQTSWRGCPRLLRTGRGFLRPVQPRHAVPELARAVRNRVRPRARRPRSNIGAYRRRGVPTKSSCASQPSGSMWRRNSAASRRPSCPIADAWCVRGHGQAVDARGFHEEKSVEEMTID